jgi:hypothetical protein
MKRKLAPGAGSSVGNGTFIKDIEHACDRLRTAPAFSVLGRVI